MGEVGRRDRGRKREGEGEGTLKKIGPVVPGEICCEIPTIGIDSFLTVECFAIGIKNDFVFPGDFDANTVICITI
jgi:hypothetical protein